MSTRLVAKKACGVHEMIVTNKSVIFLLVECVGIALLVLYCYVVPLYLFQLRNDFILYKIWLDGCVAHMRVWPLLLCLHVNGPTEQTVTPISVCYEKKIMFFVIFLHCFIHFNLFVYLFTNQAKLKSVTQILVLLRNNPYEP